MDAAYNSVMAQTKELTIIRASAALRAAGGVWGYSARGALILTSYSLRFEIALSDRQIDIPLDTITTVTRETRPSRLRLIASLLGSYLLPLVRRSHQTNLAIETESGTHHFWVGEPEIWAETLRTR